MAPGTERNRDDYVCSHERHPHPYRRPLIVAVHHNIAKVGIPWLDHYMGTVNGDQVHQVLLEAKHRLRGVFTGHIHQNLDVVHDGILYSAAASPWFQFSAYAGLTATARDQAGVPGFSVVTISRPLCAGIRLSYRCDTPPAFRRGLLVFA
jgi:hypothetical protein